MTARPNTRNVLIGVLAGAAFLFGGAPATNGASPAEKAVPSQSIFVFGEVLRPGQFSWTNGISLTNIIGRAGGFTDFANREEIEVRSGSRTQVCSYTLAVKTQTKNVMLSAGDRVYVPRDALRTTVQDLGLRMGVDVNLPPPGSREPFVYSEGQVGRPGRFPWTNTMTLSVAVKLAGGLTDAADPTRLQIRHQNGGVDTVNYRDATNSASKDPVLSRGDRIIAPPIKKDK